MSAVPPQWQLVSWQKRDEQHARIPAEWLLKSSPSPDVRTYVDIPRKCGILTDEEVRITEEYDATALSEKIRKREVSCVGVTSAFCKRAAIAHQLTNCLTEILFTDALQRAAELDAHLATGKPPLSPLHGIPVSLKDSFRIKNYDASIGIAALAFKPATENSALVDVLLDAGAVLYCKTNIPQTLMALDSHNNVFGRTLNPLNNLLTAGGSSGGEGALLGLRGSILGVGTDVGGSIRIPAMCNGLFGVKPSWQRIPYAGQENGQLAEIDKLGVSASAGPMAHSARDLELFMKVVADREPWTRDPDVLPNPWSGLSTTVNQGRKLRIGVVRRDGVVEPHPPIDRLLTEVSSSLRTSGIEVVEMDISPLFRQCQSLANALFGIEGGNHMFDLLESTGEPLSPWLATRLKRKPAMTLEKVRELQARRTELQRKFLSIWKQGDKDVDALICPVAPHPVPLIDRYNSVSYTSSFVLLDYPAGVVPVRRFTQADTAGELPDTKPIGSWDKANRELWNSVDRSVYIGSPLCVQVVTQKLEEKKLIEVMAAIYDAIKGKPQGKEVAKL